MHAAEARLYTLALVHASSALGLAVASLAAKMPKLAKQPPPWGKDEKLAAALARAAISPTSR